MKFDSDLIKKLIDLAAAGSPLIGIAISAISKVTEIKKRGRSPTTEELHKIGVEARADFKTLPKPGEDDHI